MVKAEQGIEDRIPAKRKDIPDWDGFYGRMIQILPEQVRFTVNAGGERRIELACLPLEKSKPSIELLPEGDSGDLKTSAPSKERLFPKAQGKYDGNARKRSWFSVCGTRHGKFRLCR